MLFNSFQFLIFFPIVVCLFFATPQRYRWALLLAAGYYFYGCWSVKYLGLLIATTIIDWAVALWMDAKEDKTTRRRILLLSLASNIGVLFTFKYFNFFVSTVKSLNIFQEVPTLQLVLPVGVSFYTFQSLAYTIDVYRGKMRAERNLGLFAAYVSFFPQLVAGPIERPSHLLHQFYERHEFSWPRVLDGIKLMLWGFFKKVVIADRLAAYVNPVYNNLDSYSGGQIVLATYAFAFQIFCDFSGYTDIARGAARVMGFELMLNFRQPYLSESIREFWSRWHISLSSWFRDYLYIPLGGNRVSKFGWYRNLFITFLVSGLWHGANWTFVIWGALHGLYLVAGLVLEPLRSKVLDVTGLERSPLLLGTMRKLFTFHLVLLGWIFFRANSAGDAWKAMRKMAEVPSDWAGSFALNQAPFTSARDLLFLLVILALASVYHRRQEIGEKLRSPILATAAIALQFWAIIVFGVFDNQQFIYFQF